MSEIITRDWKFKLRGYACWLLGHYQVSRIYDPRPRCNTQFINHCLYCDKEFSRD